MSVVYGKDVFELAAATERGVAVIGTNTATRRDGSAVMGRGAARQATTLDPSFAKSFGQYLNGFPVSANESRGLIHKAAVGATPYAHRMPEGYRVLCFMVKDGWWNDASLEIIAASAKVVYDTVVLRANHNFFMTRVGCGNGNLKWEAVEPLLVKILEQPNVTMIM